MNAIDLTPLRTQFPALQKTVNGRKRIFLDGAGGTQVPQRVIDAMVNYFIDINANYGGYYKTSVATDDMLIGIREDVADFINGESWEEVILGPNMTSLAYNLAWALSRDIKPGDEVVVTRLDHGANIDAWKTLEAFGAVIRYIEIRDDDCTLDYDMAARIINKKTRLVAVGYASNAVGTINDIKKLARLAHDAGALMFTDAVHYTPHFPIDVEELETDFLAYSAYKCFGPHVGFLWGKKEHLYKLNPYRPWPSYDKVPQKYNIGTPNMEGFAGTRAAIDYIAEIGAEYGGKFKSNFKKFKNRRLDLKTGMAAVAEYELGLSKLLMEGLKDVKGLKVFGITDPDRFGERCPTFSFTLKGLTSEDICKRMSAEDIYVWNGEDGLGALELVEYLDIVKIGGLLRVSIEHYNTEEEIKRFLEVLDKIAG
jgi:cysteine desulfurase family protein (TIGR01976 family)